MTERERLQSPRKYVRDWVNAKKTTKATDLDSCYLDYLEDVAAYNYQHRDQKKLVRPFVKSLAESAFFEYLRLIPEIQREETAQLIKCSKENLEPLKSWVRAVTGQVNSDDVSIMAHWVWLVKRNSRRLSVVHHIMPIVTSAQQGGGKSTAITKLIEPLNRMRLELKIPQAVDERSFTLFENYLIGFFDEMAGAEKVEISDFKRNVTSSTITYRPMRTNSVQTVQNLCSFIGASNNQLYEIIKDTTGVRRFFPIKALPLLDHTVINGIDYLELWRGVDENRERGYYENVKDSVVLKQEDLAMKDEVQLFLENYSIIPDSNTEYVSINGKLLYQEYVTHTRNEGIRFQVAAQTFYKKLRDMGLQAVKKRDERKVLSWFFNINKNNALGGTKYDS